MILDTTRILALASVAGAVGLSIAVAIMLARAAEERDLAARMRMVMFPAKNPVRPTGALARHTAGLFARLGDRVRKSSLFSGHDLAEVERAVEAAGFNPRGAASVFIGIKVVAVLLLPFLGYAYGALFHFGLPMRIALFGGSLVLGVFGPNWALKAIRRPVLTALRRGLPDALDLMVVCGEAGLGLESAVTRIAHELARSNPPTAREFMMLSRELRVLPDRREALLRMGERTGLEGYRRFGRTLAQAIRYGTPLSQALRVLSMEMRQERTLQMEEKAARLPALLVLPLILFIMPSLFIVLIGPSIIQLISTLGNSQ